MKKFNIFFYLIIALGFLLRVINLEKIPYGFFCDEASVGYNAYMILHKGTDEYGKSFPLFLRAFGEYKGPIQIYSTIPSIFFFGLNEFSVRLVSVAYGTLGILAIYLLAKEIFTIICPSKKDIIALITALFLAISPWHIHFSRTSMEGLSAFVFLTTLAVYLFLKSRRLNSSKILYFSIIVFILALYSYFPARIFIPLFIIFIFIFYLKRFSLKEIIVSFILFSLLSLPMVIHLFKGEGMSRFNQVSIFNQASLSFKQKITHVFTNYLNHFSPVFLFTKGDIDFPGQFITRHSVRGMGELYWWQVPLILLGLLFLILKIRFLKGISLVLFLWLLLYPLGSALTVDNGPQATRSIIGVIPLQIFSTIGLFYLFNLLKNRLLKIILSLGLFIIVSANLLNYLNLSFKEYPKYSSDYWGWQSGPREIIRYFRNVQNDYDELFMTGSFNAPYIFIKFYAPNDCSNCQIGGLDRLDVEKRQLFALKPEEMSLEKNKILIKKELFYPDNRLAFIIFEVKH